MCSVATLVALVGACSESGPPSGAAGPLTDVCPDPVVIQSDWYPDAEHGALYHLADPDGAYVDAERGVLTGRLVSEGRDMGVNVEIRAGGPFTEFRDVPALMHETTEILLGVVATEQAVRTYDRYPTVAVVAPLERDPLMVMWDPATHDVDSLRELPPSTVVNVFGPAPFVDHLVATGVIGADQVDPRYSGTPSRFVNSGGAIAQQGYATSDPYVYEHLEPEWGRPVRFELVHDLGWEVYSGTLAVTPANLEERAACLELLVPVVQRSVLDYVGDPDATNGLVSSLVDRFDAGFDYPRELAAWSVHQQQVLGVVDLAGPVGDIDLQRLERVIATASDVFGIGAHLTPDDLATNRFIDPSVGRSEP